MDAGRDRSALPQIRVLGSRLNGDFNQFSFDRSIVGIEHGPNDPFISPETIDKRPWNQGGDERFDVR